MANILVIDDEVEIRNFLHKVLTDFGYEVKVACDGKEGMGLFSNGYNFDLVITDINMPKMDGNSVAKRIRSSDHSDIPIVAITGSDVSKINREDFDSIIMKPFKIEALMDVIRSFT